ncbi:hypothetical protein AMTRI_Chr05g69950 [Amborella trichopoda]|uniref:Amine oxidase domain-containing protein n=1 Tax=Amborella trichopoda TaxID=13333 RepID=U5DEB4_AMBTC|nr:probable polyamine oxidase 5 [Amborella trichopoda]ERN19777.1 hypothetical protein AMTR_s00064p00094890 [Amborella trichopoda]|eukprot:XP_006858310.1 probable polyamine oxidase 5 [Amborella trichopoda]
MGSEMVVEKPKVVVVGAGMAGLTAANHLHRAAGSAGLLHLTVVEGGARIGGRIRSTEFEGERVELGATWIHGIGGSPIYDIAKRIGSLCSDQPSERMDGFPENAVTLAEGGRAPNVSTIDRIASLYRNLMDFAKGRPLLDADAEALAKEAARGGTRGIGAFLRRGLSLHRGTVAVGGDEMLDALFAMHECTERTYTSADDLGELDLAAEREYREFPDEEITIAKGYRTVIDHLASQLPPGCIQLQKQVVCIEWSRSSRHGMPVTVYFGDGSSMDAHHVIVTVSLGVLKEAVQGGMFRPPLPPFKESAVSKLGFGVVNKLFLRVEPSACLDSLKPAFPFLQMAFMQGLQTEDEEVPWWMKKTASLCPIHKTSRNVLAWFAGKEAMELESLSDEEVINGVCKTLSKLGFEVNSNAKSFEIKSEFGHLSGKMAKVLKSGWGSDPLFRGSYSFVKVGSSGAEMDAMAEPLPRPEESDERPLQLLFAGEATHRTHYSTTHGAYFSGLREADRLIKHYGWGLHPPPSS